MSIRVKLATTPAEMVGLFHVRHQVFVEEDRYLPPDPYEMIVDHYDTLPTTENLISVVNGEVAGGVRITIDSEAGWPADGSFDFRTRLPEGSRAASCSMLCLRQQNRASPRLLVGLFRMSIYWATKRGLTHLCAPMNPKAAPSVERVGFEAVSDVYEDSKGLPTRAMMLDMSKMTLAFASFVSRQDVGLWMESFERAFFERGQPIVTEGEEGDEAYLVVQGQAQALANGAGLDAPAVEEFGPGDVFGELALLTSRPRSTTVVATKATDVMVLRRDQFRRQLAETPDLAISLMESIGDRFYDAVRRQVANP